MGARKFCDRVQSELNAYLHGELDPDLRDRVETHLEECSACRAECEELRSLDHLLSSALSLSPSPKGLAEGIMQRIRKQTRTQKRDISGIELLFRMLALGVMTAAVGLGGIVILAGSAAVGEVVFDIGEASWSLLQQGGWYLGEVVLRGLVPLDAFPADFSGRGWLEAWVSRVPWGQWSAVWVPIFWLVVAFPLWWRWTRVS